LTVPDIRLPARSNRPAPGEDIIQLSRELRLNRILVPLDGSPSAEQSLAYASMIARWVNGEITLFHTLQPMHPVRVGQPGHLPYPDAQHDRGAHLAMSYLEEVAARMRPHGISARWSVATGETSHIVSSRAVTGGFGMTVVAGHPRTRVVRRIQPGVVDGLWKHTAVPLMLVNRARGLLNGAPATEPETLFVPLFGQKPTEAALPLVRLLAMSSGARVVLIDNGQKARRKLEAPPSKACHPSPAGIAQELSEAGCTVEIEQTLDGDIAVARRQVQDRASWVIVGSYMRGGVARALRGSRGDHLVRHCRGPIVVVPTAEIAKQRGRKAREESLLPESAS
jgi:nucleotide-binding universal stress UspA family protein